MRVFTITLLCSLSVLFLRAQNQSFDAGHLSGNFQADFQYYIRDTVIDPEGAAYPDERMLASGFLNLTYQRKGLTVGLRYENYQNNRVGLPPQFKGEGIPFRFARYAKDDFDITVGNYYEQFGTGLIFRAYREAGLGLDNAMDGLRLIYEPVKGLNVTGIIGRQRLYFDKGEGIVRGADADWNMGESFGWEGWDNVIVGASFVSRFQESTNPIYNLPENVAAGGGRINVILGDFNIYAEGGYKSNDPNSDNNLIYKPGTAIYATASYAKNNLGIIAGFKRYDNFLFRSERSGQLTELLINYLPPLSELHTYALPALYSYNVQGNGEIGYQGEVSYNFERGSMLGGKYGTQVSINFSNSYALDKDFIYRNDPNAPGDSLIAGTDGYTVDGLGFGDIQYQQDFNVEINKKISRNWKLTGTYYNFIYNSSALLDGVIDDRVTEDTKLNIADINAFVLEALWKIKPRHSLRFELQGLFTAEEFDPDKGKKVEQDRGDWLMALAEYSIAPKWFFAVQNTYNYSNPDPDLRVHYPLVSLGYTEGTTKFQLTYGRQQRGVFCVGGICRVVPASNGVMMTVTSNF